LYRASPFVILVVFAQNLGDNLVRQLLSFVALTLVANVVKVAIKSNITFELVGIG
jgi:hypothetical protein